MFRNKRVSYVLGLAAVVGFAVEASARAPIGSAGKNRQALLKTAAGCNPATASIDLDINNVRARLMTGGDMWWNQGTSDAAYEIPKGSGKSALFAGSVWVGGFTADKQLKVAAQLYRSEGNDYWPGPLSEIAPGNVSVDQVTCSDWDRFWKIDRATINRFRELWRTGGNTMTSEFQTIWEWPATGNGNSPDPNNNTYSRAKGTSGTPLLMEPGHNYAPFVNAPGPNNPANIYNPELGDFPGDPKINDLLGDQYIWWVFNDRGNTKGQTKTESIGMEVQTGAFAFAAKDFMNDATFYNYRLINRSTSNLDSTFMSTWTDADLGYAFDDYIGCDTIRGLGILYNGDALDGAGEPSSYGSDLPMVGVDFFRGPRIRYMGSDGNMTDSSMDMTAFTYFNNSADPRIGNPDNGIQIYNYMTGTSRNGQNFNNDFQGPGIQSTALGTGPDTRFVFFGEPGKGDWNECDCLNPPADRRFIHSAGPFVLEPGNVSDVTIGAVWVSGTGGCPNTNFGKIRLADDQAQILFDNDFKTIEGPEAPKMSKREMDKKIIFYLTNPSFSTNFLEKFGYELDTAKYRVKAIKTEAINHPDSLYKFEGYRVFQLKSDQITPAQIFDESGEVDNNVAIEVFQSDIKNGITQAVNWEKNINVRNCDTCYNPVIKVDGRDSGIRHSFEVTQDAFATGTDKSLVNYRTYYFVAIAYAINNFTNFDPGKAEVTQDVVYMESAHGPGGTAIEVVAAMPNPFSNDVGTQLNSWYGAGVSIKKLSGVGNGGNFLQLDGASEEAALSSANGYQSTQPMYEAGLGPVNIKVIDPVKVPAGNWNLYIRPDLDKAGPFVVPVAPNAWDKFVRLRGENAEWLLVKDDGTQVYSELNIDGLNEQIIEKYGISVSIANVGRPTDVGVEKNGLIAADITFSNPSLAWLAGVGDAEGIDPRNWIRSGGNVEPAENAGGPFCNYDDPGANQNPTANFDPSQHYENLLANFTFTRGTWAPYALAAYDNRDSTICGFGVARENSITPIASNSATISKTFHRIMSVDVVFTSDKSKWTKAVVVEMNEDATLTEGRIEKFEIRKHASWTGDVDGNGAAIYSTTENGFSYFPGYAINQETGERLNIVFSEDSYLSSANGRDMIWNPTSQIVDEMGNAIFGGRHYVYISNMKYDGGDSLYKMMTGTTTTHTEAYRTFIWAGTPTLNPGFSLLPLKDGLIPTETRLRFRVNRPYSIYVPPGTDTTGTNDNNGFPWYSFNTDNLAPKKLSDAGNPWGDDKQALLDRINVVPNPYYAYAGYEANRLDTRVRIINLPTKATIRIFSLDGALIRTLTKDNPTTSYLDWDIRNAKNLPIASGMYLMHVQADGIGETILRWFGAMRPVDVTQY